MNQVSYFLIKRIHFIIQMISWNQKASSDINATLVNEKEENIVYG